MMIDQSFLKSGSILNERYLIGGEVGRGGYSVVYKAKDIKLDATIAIKLLVPPPVAAISARERLRREVVALQKLHHPSIIRIYDLYDDGQRSFIIMDYINGGTLDQHVSRHGPLTEEDASTIGHQLAEALALVHRQGILHRDVKPQNIMLTDGYHAILTDFGSAKIEGMATFTATGAIVGTMEYLVPEVFQGKRPDGRSDIYSLGLSLYYAMTGKLPAGGSKHQPPTPQKEGFHPRETGIMISDDFDRIIAQATMANPGDRFHTVESLAKALSGEWKLPVRSKQRPLMFCLRCGGPDHLELSVCPSCQVVNERGSQYIFVEKELGIDRRRGVQQLLQEATGLSRKSSSLMDTVRGGKSMLRVTKEASPAVVAKLRARDIPVYSATVKQVWSKVPLSLRGLLWTNLLVGLWAGLLHFWYFVWLSPLFFVFSLLIIKRTTLAPLIHPGATALHLPKPLEAEIFKTLATLPTGTALDLFANIARTGSSIHETLQQDSLDPLMTKKVESSLTLACKVAQDLGNLDQTLLDVSKQAHSYPSQKTLITLMGNCEIHRDKLTQKLLELLSVFAAMQASEGNRADASLPELEQITEELNEDAKIQSEAAAEVQAYLASGYKEEDLCLS